MPGPHATDKTVFIHKNNSLAQTAQALVQKGVIVHYQGFAWGFLGAALISGKKNCLKAGEYLVPARATPWEIIHLLASGKVVIHHLTVPEGLTDCADFKTGAGSPLCIREYNVQTGRGDIAT